MKSRLLLLAFVPSFILMNYIDVYSSSLNYDRVNSLIESGNYEDAIAYLDEVSLGNPNDVYTLFYYGYVLDEMGRYTEALDYYDKVLWFEPNDVYTLYNKAVTLENIGDYENAIVHYDRVLKIDPVDIDAIMNKGIILYNLEKYENAKIEFKNVLKIENGNSEAKSYINKINAIQPPSPQNYSWIIMPVSVLGGIGFAIFNHRRRKKIEST